MINLERSDLYIYENNTVSIMHVIVCILSISLVNVITLHMEITFSSRNIITKGVTYMRNKEDLKTVRRTVLMTEKISRSIDQEAMERGIKPNAVMNERLNHISSGPYPPIMAEFQDYANTAVRMMVKYSEADAIKLEKEAHKLWIF